MTAPPTTRRYCGLCTSPKVDIGNDIWVCNHCDTTVGCKPNCGACLLAQHREFVID